MDKRPTPERKRDHERDLCNFLAERFDRLDLRLETLANAVHRIEHGQDAVRAALTHLERNTENIMSDLTRLTQEVSETATAIDSAIALINGLAQQIRDLEPTQEALNAFADTLDAKSNALAEAVTANTPAAPPEEP